MINKTEQKEFFKEVFREVVVEVMQEEKLSFYDSIFPNASKIESEEIEKDYGSPEDYNKKDFVDMTKWINNAD